MDRRFFLAVTLMMAVLVLPSIFMKRPAPRTRPAVTQQAGQDTTRTPRDTVPSIGAAPAAPAAPEPVTAGDGDTASLSMDGASYTFSSSGATLIQATLDQYRDMQPSAPGAVRLIRPGSSMLGHTIALERDTVRFGSVEHQLTQGANGLVLAGTSGALRQDVTVSPVSGHPYLLDVSGTISGLGRGALLIVSLGDGLANVEADSNDNFRNYGVAMRRDRPDNVNFRSLDPGERREYGGPLDWVAVKTKYFMGALLSADSTRPQIGGTILTGMPRTGRGNATRMATQLTMPIGPDGRFQYRLYLGPQTQRTLEPLGRRLDQASSYGWIFRPIVMPVAGWITKLFLWMHERFNLSFGMVLVVFGILVRLVLWPLNQKAMKSQVAMMAVQPVLKDIQTRYKNDPAKLQQEMMKVYKEHNVNPLGGCLPLLIPMPVLLALFFVFNRAIELRGTPFLWLPDLSLKDPFYITPIVMGLSMYALSKLSQQGMPPNPQTKMMTIFMPIMMTMLFLNFASGLNLYYAVSNIVSLPQQWLINKSRAAEMARRQVSRS